MKKFTVIIEGGCLVEIIDEDGKVLVEGKDFTLQDNDNEVNG